MQSERLEAKTSPTLSYDIVLDRQFFQKLKLLGNGSNNAFQRLSLFPMATLFEYDGIPLHKYHGEDPGLLSNALYAEFVVDKLPELCFPYFLMYHCTLPSSISFSTFLPRKYL